MLSCFHNNLIIIYFIRADACASSFFYAQWAERWFISMIIKRNGIEIELSYEELEQAVKEYEQKKNCSAEGIRQIDITKEDIRCTSELVVNTDHIEAAYEMWCNVDQYFGTNTREDASSWVNFYTCWYPDGKITAFYILSSDIEDVEVQWDLTEEERVFFCNKMEQNSQEKDNMTLQELWNSFHNEDTKDDNKQNQIIKSIGAICDNEDEGLFGFVINETDDSYDDVGNSVVSLFKSNQEQAVLLERMLIAITGYGVDSLMQKMEENRDYYDSL